VSGGEDLTGKDREIFNSAMKVIVPKGTRFYGPPETAPLREDKNGPWESLLRMVVLYVVT